jgi:hypothetical protein
MQRYEIFEKLPSKQVAPVESATTLDDAKERIKQLEQMFRGEYFIFDSENQCVMVPLDPESLIAPDSE